MCESVQQNAQLITCEMDMGNDFSREEAKVMQVCTVPVYRIEWLGREGGGGKYARVCMYACVGGAGVGEGYMCVHVCLN